MTDRFLPLTSRGPVEQLVAELDGLLGKRVTEATTPLLARIDEQGRRLRSIGLPCGPDLWLGDLPGGR